ncbi:hypothetical protein C0992_012146 [Termitomyces sp. T32_za158]|nr:hypothetical protein C0992_012146 [Termitomyces sp. T32_za158]
MLEAGEIICYNGEDSTIEWKRLVLGGIGNSVLSPDGSVLLVDNLNTNDFDIFRFPAGNLQATIPSKSLERVVKGIAFAECGKFIVCGSDQRFAQIINSATHRVCQELVTEDPSDILQTIAVASLGEHRHLIACGSSSKRPAIYVWEKVDYGFDDQPSVPQTPVLQTHTSTLQSRYTKLFDTFLVSIFNFLLILLWSTHAFWMPYLWKCIDSVRIYVSSATQVLDPPLDAPSELFAAIASTSSTIETLSNTFQPTFTQVVNSLPT